MRRIALRLFWGLLPIVAAVIGALALLWADAPAQATPRAPQPSAAALPSGGH